MKFTLEEIETIKDALTLYIYEYDVNDNIENAIRILDRIEEETDLD